MVLTMMYILIVCTNEIGKTMDIVVRELYHNMRQFDYLDNLKQCIVAVWECISEAAMRSLVIRKVNVAVM